MVDEGCPLGRGRLSGGMESTQVARLLVKWHVCWRSPLPPPLLQLTDVPSHAVPAAPGPPPPAPVLAGVPLIVPPGNLFRSPSEASGRSIESLHSGDKTRVVSVFPFVSLSACHQ